ncbi:MAG TPA: cation-transporting P-type ATPase [Nitrososphaeraceae archaeon]
MTDTHQEIEYWNIPATELVRRLGSNQVDGLSSSQAKERLATYGKNLVTTDKKKDSLSVLISQFKTPIIVIFIFTAVLSFFLGEEEDALIIIIIVVISVVKAIHQKNLFIHCQKKHH